MSMNISSIYALAQNYLSFTASSSTNASTDSSSSASNFSSNLDSMTISQIRDLFDKMAIAGELTTQQQMVLIDSGLQDLNAEDPSYQPAGTIGYQRSDTGTYNLESMLSGYAGFNGDGGFTDIDTGQFTSNASAWKNLLEKVQTENSSSTSSNSTSVDVTT
jgi:hypothetical protein